MNEKQTWINEKLNKQTNIEENMTHIWLLETQQFQQLIQVEIILGKKNIKEKNRKKKEKKKKEKEMN